MIGAIQQYWDVYEFDNG